MEGQFQFSAWVKYGEYQTIWDVRLRGIYLLAHFDTPPTQAPSVTDKNVIYIGGTTEQSMATKLLKFGQAAFQRAPAHSGGKKYSDGYLNSSIVEEPPENLYVATMGIPLTKTDEAKVYIKYLEQAAVWAFFQENKSLPRCNTV
ncbi:hypothetical protein [Pandoraea communis]|uniref:hypothetical protein n=1 Tax=Pandoraea communis TaxID=2508297 RepID=UPI0025A5017C|nr:hypothetical protein [Pandoraea communis]MDM8356170.1 hypothetical protein [Pandoraea communis]